MVEMFLKIEDTNLDAETEYGWKALDIATSSEYCNFGKILLEKYPRLTDLLKDVASNDVDLITVIDSSPIIEYLYSNDDCYKTLKQYLFDNLNDAVGYILHNTTANINQPLEEGQTLLHIAANNLRQDTVELLIEKGNADPNILDNDGKTPLIWAVINEDLPMVKFLLEVGKADINLAQDYSETVLFLAVEANNTEMVEYLVTNPEVTFTNGRDSTPLYKASILGYLPIVKLLLEKGGGCNGNLNNLNMVLYIATSQGHLNILKYLIEDKHISPGTKTYYGATPLITALKTNQFDVAKYILSTGRSDVNAKYGRITALQVRF